VLKDFLKIWVLSFVVAAVFEEGTEALFPGEIAQDHGA
jgi:hypothetical protein